MRAEYLRTLLEYNPALGEVRWLKDTDHFLRGQTARKGKVAGDCGQISICGQSYATHLVAWILFNGQHPVSYIRFLDGNRKNIRIDNMTDTGSKVDKVCIKCNKRVVGEDNCKKSFYAEPKHRSGLTSQCRECMDKASSKSRKAHVKPKKVIIDEPKAFMPPIVQRSLAQTKPRHRHG